MKAVQYISFGNSEVLKLSDVKKPVCGDDDVLIKIAATTINPLDIKIRTGSMQKIMPVELPWIPGSDAAGVAEAVGKNVTRIKAGDSVFATGFGGTYADYVVIKEDHVALMPAGLSANEAVALAVPLNTAYTVIVELGQLQKGQRLLIQGAAGAVGATMLQMAKALGAYVIGTASGKGVELIKELGADEAVDYKTQDVSMLVKDVDLVADLAGGLTQAKLFETLKKGGKLLSIVSPPSTELAEKYEVSAQFVSSNPSYKKLDFGKQLVEAGEIKAQISEVMKLEQAAEAQDLHTKGGVNGKIVLKI